MGAASVPGSQLALDARVLIAGDHTVWDPGGAAAGVELWAHLRLFFCRLASCLALKVLQGGQWSGFHSRCMRWLL